MYNPTRLMSSREPTLQRKENKNEQYLLPYHIECINTKKNFRDIEQSDNNRGDECKMIIRKSNVEEAEVRRI